MNSALLSILGPPPANAAATQTGSTGQSATLNGDAFGLVLSGQLTAHAQTSKPVAPVAGSDGKATALAAKIASMLKAGATEAEVIARLAAHLATSVTHALGTPAADAQSQLQAVFAGALAAPGDSASTAASPAHRSAALAQRFLHVQAIATDLITPTTGQQKRIAGKFLDAKTAEEIPAQVSATMPGGAPAAGALTGGASPVKPAPEGVGAIVTANAVSRAAATAAAANAAAASAAAASAAAASTTAADASAANAAPGTSMAVSSATPSAPAPIGVANGLAQSQSAFTLGAPAQLTLAGSGSDGRRVAFDSKALSGAGDTVLGRVLTRAALAADARASVGSVPAPPNAASAEQLATSELESAAASADAQTPIAAFVASFAAAMGTAAPAKAVADGDPSAVVSPLTLAAPDGAAPAFVPAVAPFAIERLAPTAMSTPAAPAAPVDQSAIVDQVLRGAFMRNTGESSEMRLSLVPETLGDVNVKLVISGGNVSAHVLAQTPEVRDALIAAQPQLTKSLADAGLKLQSFNVDLSGDGFAGFSQQQGSQSQQGGARARQTALADDEFDDSTLDAIPSFGPSVPTPTFAGDYNYLA